MADSPDLRLARARESLEGLSVGDAFGECYFGRNDIVGDYLRNRRLLDAPWPWTDDTSMALSIFENLRQCGEIDQEMLAKSFAHHFDSVRGYGAGARRLLIEIFSGARWQEAAGNMFGGSGSFGNGAAMRITPLGAYFADDMDALIENARRSAEVTHAHPEGIAGCIATAAAAAVAWQARGSEAPSSAEFIDRVLPFIPESEVKDKTLQARKLASQSAEHAALILGSGREISAQDTVPFVLWCAGQYLYDYEEAMWSTVSGLGDRDTTCAMVGGIVACCTGVESIPQVWRDRREPLPEWAIGSDK